MIRGRVLSKKLIGFNTKEKVLFVTNKILHVLVTIDLPARVFGLANALIGHAVFYGVLGLVLALLFQVAYIFKGSVFHNVEVVESTDQ